MVGENGSPITVWGDGNIVGGRDVNIASRSFSIDQVPPAFRPEFETVEKFVKTSDSVEAKHARVRKLARDMTTSGFGAAAGAIVTYLLALL